MDNYPESLVRRNEQLEKSIEIHKLELSRLEEYNHQLKWDIKVLKQKLEPDELSGSVPWFWQNDGYDYSRSMRNDQCIIISGLKILA